VQGAARVVRERRDLPAVLFEREGGAEEVEEEGGEEGRQEGRGMSRIPALEKMLRASGDRPDPDVLYMLAQEHAKIGEFARAVEWYDRCLAADAAYCYAYYHKALAQESAGRRAEGVATLRAGLDAARRHGDAKATSEIGALLDQWT
jgi:tetratricopeptide (TPR) repeat protein